MTTTAIPPSVDLTDLLARAKAKGYLGVIITQQRASDPDYVAMLLNHRGEPTGPRNFDPMPTPEAALADLARQL